MYAVTNAFVGAVSVPASMSSATCSTGSSTSATTIFGVTAAKLSVAECETVCAAGSASVGGSLTGVTSSGIVASLTET